MAIHGVAFPADYIQMGPDQRHDHRMPEAQAVSRLLAFQPGRDVSLRITSLALRLAQRVRATPPGPLSAESFLRHYGLSTREGVALMCVAEALLRIPDPQTADALLRDKLSSGNWSLTKDDASFVSSAADWALMLTGTLARWRGALLRRLFERDPRRRPARQPLGQAHGAAPALRGDEACAGLF